MIQLQTPRLKVRMVTVKKLISAAWSRPPADPFSKPLRCLLPFCLDTPHTIEFQDRALEQIDRLWSNQVIFGSTSAEHRTSLCWSIDNIQWYTIHKYKMYRFKVLSISICLLYVWTKVSQVLPQNFRRFLPPCIPPGTSKWGKMMQDEVICSWAVVDSVHMDLDLEAPGGYVRVKASLYTLFERWALGNLEYCDAVQTSHSSSACSWHPKLSSP